MGIPGAHAEPVGGLLWPKGDFMRMPRASDVPVRVRGGVGIVRGQQRPEKRLPQHDLRVPVGRREQSGENLAPYGLSIYSSPTHLSRRHTSHNLWFGRRDAAQQRRTVSCGLWKDTLMRWYRESVQRGTAQSADVYKRDPTWSWALVDGPVLYPGALHYPAS
ncbi:hypothetical protein N657DRAFT_256370 [Parathielavia appendiculata]|uniref:Uncharacterized protein n=1 Tax=Parathielavia appendiculata TaxID=2587402 RepID=A0AAN6TSW7_9PEZI|nr:hypothetical protein N657DRAFT_256370 [Parathielavia appendiculata]